MPLSVLMNLVSCPLYYKHMWSVKIRPTISRRFHNLRRSLHNPSLKSLASGDPMPPPEWHSSLREKGHEANHNRTNKAAGHLLSFLELVTYHWANSQCNCGHAVKRAPQGSSVHSSQML